MKKLRMILIIVAIILSMSTVCFGATYNFSKTLYKKGQRSEEIKLLQDSLRNAGVFTANSTGYYGSITYNAVKKFQKKYNLSSDGIVGKITIQKLNELSLFNDKNHGHQEVSRGEIIRSYGQILDWWKQVKDTVLHIGDEFTVQDFKTKRQFKMKYTYGTNHADVEPLTKADTNTIKSIWGGFNWSRRPVLVFKGSTIIAGSMIGMPHAGLDSQPAGKYISNRSGGYGYGQNLDSVKNNGMDGVLCLHFLNSKTHGSKKIDPKHQSAIKEASGK